jgi:hypothetical protein
MKKFVVAVVSAVALFDRPRRMPFADVIERDCIPNRDENAELAEGVMVQAGRGGRWWPN